MSNSKTLAIFGLVATLAIPVVSQAAIKTNRIEGDKVVVTYSKSELQTASGRAAIESQLQRAALKICGHDSYNEVRSLSHVSDQKSCLNDTVQNAMRQLHGYTASTD